MSARFGSMFGNACIVEPPTHEQFTDDQRAALISAHRLAVDEERTLRMTQTEIFCRGQDALAERFDDHVARSTRISRTLGELVDVAYGVAS